MGEIEVSRLPATFQDAVFTTRAYKQTDGFLGPRPERDYVTVEQGERASAFYICENIDDFASDILDRHLNKRGWVLQEHALARRTIFFSERQTY